MKGERGTEAELRADGGSRSVPVFPLLLSVAVGVLAGIGSYTFSYANGFSYFSTELRACVNCHITQSQYDWLAESQPSSVRRLHRLSPAPRLHPQVLGKV